MTDRLIEVTTENVEDGSEAVLVLGSPVGRVYQSDVIDNEVAFTIPDTVLKNSFATVSANVTVTSGSYTASMSVIIEPDDNVSILSIPSTVSSFAALMSGIVVSDIQAGSDHTIRIDWVDGEGSYVGQQDSQHISLTSSVGSVVLTGRSGVTNIYTYTPPSTNETNNSVTFSWGRFNDSTLTDSTVANTTMPISEAYTGGPILHGSGTVLQGTEHTITWSDPNGITGRRYDLWINGRDQGLSVVYPTNEWHVTELPRDGSPLTVELIWWDNDDFSANQRVSVVMISSSLPEPVGVDDMSQFYLPDEDVSEGSFDSDVWEEFVSPMNSLFWEAQGDSITSITNMNGNRAMCVRLSPETDGSTRAGGGITIPDSQTASVSFMAYFDPDFDWGGLNEGGKFGFGLRGGPDGSDASDGNGGQLEGFTSRFIWGSGGELFANVYDADAPTNGTNIPLNVTAPRGEWFQLTMTIGVNAAGVDNGTLICAYNGVEALKENERKWFAQGTPVIDTITFHAYHSGDDSTWSPNRDNMACFASVYWVSDGMPDGLPVFETQPSVAVSGTSAVVTFEANQNVQALTEIRPSGGSWSYAVEETSFRWAAHRQVIDGLSYGTTYDYRVTITTESGESVVSAQGTFNTEESPNGAAIDGSLIMGGIMYGSRHHGWRLNHNYLHRSNHVAIRFIAEEGGKITRVSKHNRQGNHYHEGNGGNYHLRIHPSVNNLPDESVTLGQSDPAIDYILTDGPSTGTNRIWVDIDWESGQPDLVAGEEYWIYWDSRTEAGNGRSIFNSSQCGDYYESVDGITDRGPYPGPYDLQLYDKTNKSDSWQSLRPYLMPWVCWEMDSGRIRGNTMYTIYGQNLDDGTYAASRTIEGSKVARQRFTADRTLTIDGLWLFWGHTWKHGIDGSPLSIKVKNSSGTVLATASIAAIPELSSICRAGEANNDIEARTTKTWSYADLSADVVLTSGQTYDIELSSGASGGFALSTGFPWPRTDHTGDKYTDGIWETTQLWSNSRAEIISEGRWTPIADYNDGAREIDMKLTIKGQPKRMY